MTVKAKEKPIIFSVEMVRAILDGSKTQTRRLVKPQPDWDDTCQQTLSVAKGEAACDICWPDGIRNCPYGMPGDELWVREAFALTGPMAGSRPIYRATEQLPPYLEDNTGKGWRPSIHMPRWASRIQLRITDVRVERVQHISDGDAIAEGLFQRCGDVHPGITEYSCGDEFWTTKPWVAFGRLWDSINGDKPGCAWDDSPWVWVVEFEPC